MKLHRLAGSGCAWLGRGLWTLVVWTTWLALAVLLAGQAYVLSHRELDAPPIVLRLVQERLASAGVGAHFGRARFDPTGSILFEDAAFTLPGYEEPLVTARALYVRLDPWALLSGRFEPADIRVTGVGLRVPAMFSPTGQADEVIRDLDGDLVPLGGEILAPYLNFRLGGVAVSARGAVRLASSARPRGAEPVAGLVARDYAAISRELADAVESLQVLERPVLRVVLEPAEPAGATAAVTVFADGLRLSAPIELRARGLSAEGRLALGGPTEAAGPISLVFTAEELRLPRRMLAHGVRATVEVALPPGRLSFDRGVVRRIELTAADVAAEGVRFEAPLVSLAAGPLPRVRASARALLFGQAEFARCDADLDTGEARLRLDGSAPAALLGPLGRRLGFDLRRYASLSRAVALAGEARLGPAWKFQRAWARFALAGATVWHVPIDEARGRVEFDGRRLTAPEVYLRIGDSHARGRYEQDLATRDYRLLLDGALRPPAIGGWFPPQSWWHEFFRPFAFSGPAPAARVDLHGSWAPGRNTEVFVAVESAQPAFRGVKFDWVRGRLLIGPGFEAGLEFQAARGTESARGAFLRRYDLTPGGGEQLDLALDSTLDPAAARRLLGPKEGAILDPFHFSRPPAVTLTVHLGGADAAAAENTAHLSVSTDGDFAFHDFPFSGIAFTADVAGDRIALTRVSAGFGGGTVTGSGTVSGRGALQRVDFNLALQGASLGRAIASADSFFSKRSPASARAASHVVQAKSSVRLDLAAAGAGPTANFLAFHGGGTVSIQGAQLGQLQLLGLLSQLLPFTSVRFTAARGDFQLDGPQLVFTDVNVAGANSAITAHGTYGLDSRQLDFKAKFFPFQKSKTLPQVLIGSVLTPFSEILEVKLTGTLDKPSWAFERGPTNFLRALTPTAPAVPKTPTKPF